MLARDPVCGTTSTGPGPISARGGGEVRYFCSEDCRAAYRQARRGSAARA